MPDPAALDSAAVPELAEMLRSCCDCRAWVCGMMACRPFRTRAKLLAAAREIWRALPREAWLEAFAHHPRIGERSGALAQTARGTAWSRGEQAGVAPADDAARAALRQINEQYERRFGYIYIVFASGRSATELLTIARERLAHAPDEELQIAAAEQEKIMCDRLDKLLAQEGEVAR